jgi:hypothetical protein
MRTFPWWLKLCWLSYNLMLNSEKNIRALCDKKK